MKRTRKRKSVQELKDNLPDSKYGLERIMTKRQYVFCHEYVRDWNAARAARVAGYSKKSASNVANEILEYPYIQKYLDLITNDVAAEVGLSKINLLSELKAMALSDVSKLYEDWITPKQFEKLKKEHPEIMKAIQEVSTKTETKMNEEKELIQVNYIHIKFYDKQKAIDSIFTNLGWKAAEKVELSVEQPLFGGK